MSMFNDRHVPGNLNRQEIPRQWNGAESAMGPYYKREDETAISALSSDPMRFRRYSIAEANDL